MGGIAREQDAPDPIPTRHARVRAEKLRFIGVPQPRPGRNRCDLGADRLKAIVVLAIRLEREPATTVAQRNAITTGGSICTVAWSSGRSQLAR
jgi:hypothetical protein